MDHFDSFQWILAAGFGLTILGAWLATRERLGVWRWGIALPALAALPVGSGLALWWDVRGREGYSLYADKARPLLDFRLPFSSQGVFEPDPLWSVIVQCDRGGLLWVGGRCTLAELQTRLSEHPDAVVMLSMDRDAPFQHLAWILDVARAAGRDRVRLAARRQPGIDRPGYWPDVAIELPLRAGGGGRTLRILGLEEVARLWGPWGAQWTVRMPSRVAYSLDQRQAEARSEVVDWIREAPITCIDADPATPLRFIVEILDEMLSAGVPLPALGRNGPDRPPPREEVLHEGDLPYPTREE